MITEKDLLPGTKRIKTLSETEEEKELEKELKEIFKIKDKDEMLERIIKFISE